MTDMRFTLSAEDAALVHDTLAEHFDGDDQEAARLAELFTGEEAAHKLYDGADFLIDPGEADLDGLIGRFLVELIQADGTSTDMMGADTQINAEGELVWYGHPWNDDTDSANLDEFVEIPYELVKLVRIY